MNNNTKNVLEKLILVMEEHEAAVRKAMKDKDERIPKDHFMAGWSHGIHLSWEHLQPEEKWGFEGKNEISCFFEFNGISLRREKDMDEKTEIDLKFLTKDIFKEDIVPALRKWAQSKVENEPFGGLYGANFCIAITLKTTRPVRKDDPAHQQGGNWEQEYIRVSDEKRIVEQQKKVHNFISKEEYIGIDINEIDNSFVSICSHAVKIFFEEFGAEKLNKVFEALLKRAKTAKFESSFSDLMQGFANAAAILTSTKDERNPSEEELLFACKICMMILLNTKDKYEREWGKKYLKAAAELGCKEAKNIMKYGTGKIPMDVIIYKDKLVNCAANDIEKVVDLKIKEETALAYKAMVEYLTKLIKNDFPGEYLIKFNSKVKNYIDTQLKQSKTNNFFANAAQYPEVYDALKAYFKVACDEYNYYSDASDEEAVSCGGYAAMALAFADPISNFSIAIEFLKSSDFEHAITARYFAQDFAEICTGKEKKQVEAYAKEY